MAKMLSVTRRWPDGEVLSVEVPARNAYPDAVDEARAIAVRLYAEALEVTLTADDKHGKPVEPS